MIIQTLFSILFAFQVHATSNEVSGEITLGKGATIKPGGVLFVMAKKGPSPMPVAVLRVPDPKFPYHFTMTDKNLMAPGTPFAGPFIVSAKYSPTGDAMDKSGPKGQDNTPVEVGSNKVKIELK